MVSEAATGRRSTRVRLLVFLFRRFPPKHVIFRDPHPRPLEEYHDERRFPFHRYFGLGPELFLYKDVLDLGCGFGGRPVAYLEHGAGSVAGVEVDPQMVEIAGDFAARQAARGTSFVLGSGESIPFPSASFDLVTMNDVMEHVVSPKHVLAECWRVLRPGGRLALVFPPYYDLTAGSHLSGYATSIPALNAWFSTDTLRAAARIVLDERMGSEWTDVLREEPTDKLWNLNGLTARGFRRLTRDSPFTREQIRYIGHLDHRLSDHSGLALAGRAPLFALAELPSQVPLLQELVCLRICAILRKPSNADELWTSNGAPRPVTFREDAKEAAVVQWSADPCGPHVEEHPPGTRAYFDALVRARSKYAPWIADALGYEDARGLEVLDIGCGQGIDLCALARAGARVTGIDLTPRHVALARQHLAAMDLSASVVHGDAESLPFPDLSFDRVVSNGVLHHTPDLPAALREIRRVLRPGGETRIILYNRASFHYWLDEVLRYGILAGDLLRERSMTGVLASRVERTSVGARPLVRVHSPRRARDLARNAGFTGISSEIRHFRLEDTFLTKRLAGHSERLARLGILDRLGRVGGWYVVVRGRRPLGWVAGGG